jgi:SAM-dependent methyltransferase
MSAPSESLGLGLMTGDAHYRAYVGPPEDYDLIAAMTFNLLTTIGLRQHHTLLDVGCGSLRVGRLLIPYLNRFNYAGIEPNAWLIEEGITREIGRDMVEIKRPRFLIADSAEILRGAESSFDFAVAQSIFSHCGPDLLARWLRGLASLLTPTGALLATFLPGTQSCVQTGWIYPKCVEYRLDSMQGAAEAAGLQFEVLDWRHPRQTWGLFAKPGFDAAWFREKSLTWNAKIDSGRT